MGPRFLRPSWPLLVFLLVCGWVGVPRPAAAQAHCILCGSDTAPPTIGISPVGGTYNPATAPTVAVSIDLCDASGVNNASTVVTLRGTDVSGQVSWTSPFKSGCPSHFVGTLQAVLAQGSNAVGVTASDLPGNSGSASATYVWDPNADLAPPTISASPGSLSQTSSALTVTFTWADDKALSWATRKVRFNGADVTASFPLSSQSTAQGTSAGSVTLLAGANTFVDSIADNAGKWQAAAYTYYYDTSAPTLTVASGLAASAPDSLRPVTVTWKDPGRVNTSGGLKVLLNGMNVTGSFTTTSTPAGDSASSVATLKMALGEDVLDVQACDVFAHCATQRVTYVRYVGPKQAPVLSLEPHHGEMRNVALFGGNLSYSTAPYVSMDVPHSATVLYSTGQARPAGFVQIDAADYSSAPPAQMSLGLLNASGAAVTFTGGQTELFFGAGSGKTRLAAQFDATSLATGAYAYTAVVKSWFAGDPTPTQSTIPVRVVVVNEMASPFGAGWSLAGLAHLYVQSDGVLVTSGDGSAEFFQQGTCVSSNGVWSCAYTPPVGEFATLSYLSSQDPAYTLTDPSGGKSFFRSSGLLAYRQDRFGNQVTFGYDASSRLSTITDPTGRQIVLGYGGTGRLATITDQPGGRTSRFTASAGGDLTAIYDADGARADSIVYGTAHQVSSWTDRAGGVWSVGYDAFGQVASLALPPVPSDSGVITPVSTTRSLAATVLPAAGAGTSAVPAPRLRPAEAWVRITDPRGDSSTYLPDRFGRPAQFRDRENRIGYTYRNALGQDTLTVSPKGDAVRYA
jgi:YD repeat-containing protein